LHLVAESCIICSTCARRPVRKLLDIPSYQGRLATEVKFEETTNSLRYWLSLSRFSWPVTQNCP